MQEVGYFMSPGDRSYDAIGLMKEVSEQTAAACASAQEVLGNETPQSLLKGRRGKYENHHKDKKNHFTNSRSTLAPDILVRSSLSLALLLLLFGHSNSTIRTLFQIPIEKYRFKTQPSHDILIQFSSV